jgi:hypothetical protein
VVYIMAPQLSDVKNLFFLLFISISCLLVLITLIPDNGAEGLVIHAPVQPSHEDDITITYVPEPEDNTSLVRLRYLIDDLEEEVLDLQEDPDTGNFSHVLGGFPPGTTISYSITAWNKTVGEDEIIVASIVQMNWYRDIDGAKAASNRLGRPIMIFFESQSSDDSYRMHTTTFTDERVLNLSAEFIAVKIDVDKDVTTALDEFKIESTPSVVFLDNTSQEVHRVYGYRKADALLKDMAYALGNGPKPETDEPALDPAMIRYPVMAAMVLLSIIALMVLLLRRSGGNP